MKINHIYIASAIIIVILGLIFLNREKTEEVKETDNQIFISSTSTPAKNTSKVVIPATNSTKKPTPSPSSTNTPKSTPTSHSQTQEPVSSIPSLSSLNNLMFRLTSYNGVAIPSDSRYILTFEDGFLRAKFCNNISGNFLLDGSLIKADNLVSTKMYCGLPTNLMEIETSFVSMLNFGARIFQSGNKIILSHSNGTVMVFTGF